MKLSPAERTGQKEAFRKMTAREKIDHIYTYYKWPILLGLVAMVILCSTIHRMVTRKDVVLYTAYVNVAVGADLESVLHEEYLNTAGMDTQKSQVFFYRDLYLSNDPSAEDHEFAYASRMKILATVSDQKLDLVFMNREAYDILSRSGYLSELSELLPEALQPYLTTNAVVLEDNSIDFNLGNTDEYNEITEDSVNAIEVSTLPLFRQAGFPDTVYLGIISNTPRLSECTDYLAYLASTAE